MAELNNFSDPLIGAIQEEKRRFWDSYSFYPEDQRQILWTQRAQELTFLLGTDPSAGKYATNSPSSLSSRAHPPRSLSYGGTIAKRRRPSHEVPTAMDRTREFSQQSAPAAVCMSRNASTSRSGNASFTSNGAPTASLNSSSQPSMASNWSSGLTEEPFSAYNFRTAPTTRQDGSRGNPLPEVPELQVYDVQTFVSKLPKDNITPSPGFTQSLMSNGEYWKKSNAPHLSVSSDQSQVFGNLFESSYSPSTPTTGELTNGTTFASDMSRQDTSTSICNGFNMFRLHSNVSSFDINGEQSQIDHTQSFIKGSDCEELAVTAPEHDTSHFLRYAGGIGEDFSFSDSFSYSAVEAPVSSCSLDAEGMKRSYSNESNKSTSSTQSSSSRALRRRQETLQQSTRPLAPKHTDEATTMSRQLSEHKMVRVTSADGSCTSDRIAISKTPYTRPNHPRVKCTKCNDNPEGFRGEHELRRHTDRMHKKNRKAFVNVDVSDDQKFLANCKACRTGKVYGAYYNAAAHLRRAHFNPRKGRGGKGKSTEKRGGKGGGDTPSMDVLKKWMKEVTVPGVDDPIPHHLDDAEDAEDSDMDETAMDLIVTTCDAPQIPAATSFDDTFSTTEAFNLTSMRYNNDTNVLLPASSAPIIIPQNLNTYFSAASALSSIDQTFMGAQIDDLSMLDSPTVLVTEDQFVQDFYPLQLEDSNIFFPLQQ
ncbi:MAG: hypothetical protein M1827_006916 [Pycnora praestabilis]|nr:MAG: hypothetical protein M1827_006916 [Pycnora praestabilis]